MYQHDSVLKMYAKGGMRTLEDWASVGRDVTGGAKPRVDAAVRGETVALYARDQTHPRTSGKPELV